RLERGRSGLRRLRPVGHSIRRRLSDEAAPRELLALCAARGERFLGTFPSLGHVPQPALHLLATSASLRDGGLCLPEPGELPAQLVATELPACLQALALDPSVELSGLGLALERTQARARLAL